MIKPFFILILILNIIPSVIAADSLVVVAVGDIMMGTTYPDVWLPPDTGRHLFDRVRSILSAGDLTLANLEGPMLDGGTCTKVLQEGRSYAFRTPPSYAANLSAAGFDFVNLANNHLDDFGAAGRDTTIMCLESSGLVWGGPAGRTGRFEVRGRTVGIVSFSFSAGSNSYFEVPAAQRLVADEARRSDYVIVCLHGGGEGVKYMHTPDSFEYFLGWPRGNVVKFARAVVDSGADLVWGHGPHVPRAMEIYRDRLIAYSLGNFCTWAGFNLDAERRYAPILEAVLDSTGVFVCGRLYSGLQTPGQYLTLDAEHRAGRLIKRLSEEDFPNSFPTMSDDGAVAPRLP